MNYSKQHGAIEFAKESFRKNSDIVSRAKYIRDHMDDKYGHSWHCLVMFNPKYWYTFLHSNSNTSIYFKIGKYKIHLHQT